VATSRRSVRFFGGRAALARTASVSRSGRAGVRPSRDHSRACRRANLQVAGVTLSFGAVQGPSQRRSGRDPGRQIGTARYRCADRRRVWAGWPMPRWRGWVRRQARDIPGDHPASERPPAADGPRYGSPKASDSCVSSSRPRHIQIGCHCCMASWSTRSANRTCWHGYRCHRHSCCGCPHHPSRSG
jgi:hypothetical protein